jgi:hypothetical protein
MDLSGAIPQGNRAWIYELRDIYCAEPWIARGLRGADRPIVLPELEASPDMVGGKAVEDPVPA